MVALLMATQTLTRSRAGLLFSVLALLAGVVLAITAGGHARASGGRRKLVLAGLVVVVATSQLGLYRVLDRFALDPLADQRIALARNTWRAAVEHLPFGSGVGTFVPVYASYEPLGDVRQQTFVNRAHNDILELSLESGMLGLALLAAAIAWLAWGAWLAWRRADPRMRPIDVALPRAASVIVGLLLLHSFVDYPLRTMALMSLFAFAGALLVPAEVRESDLVAVPQPPEKKPRRERMAAVRTTPGDAPASVAAGAPFAMPAWPKREAEGAADAEAARSWPAHAPLEASSARLAAGAGTPRPAVAAAKGGRWSIDGEWPEAWRKAGTTPRRSPAGASPPDGGTEPGASEDR
jgi:hypothetical protein